MANAGATSAPKDLVALLPIALGLLASEGETYASLKQDLRRWATEDPIDALVTVVIGGGIAFYLAERDTNAACKQPWDGILYIATSLSVGYDNAFPTTPAGHALATFVQTFGPSLAANAFEPTAAEVRSEAARAAAVDEAILARLDDIVRLLQPRAATA